MENEKEEEEEVTQWNEIKTNKFLKSYFQWASICSALLFHLA